MTYNIRFRISKSIAQEYIFAVIETDCGNYLWYLKFNPLHSLYRLTICRNLLLGDNLLSQQYYFEFDELNIFKVDELVERLKDIFPEYFI